METLHPTPEEMLDEMFDPEEEHDGETFVDPEDDEIEYLCEPSNSPWTVELPKGLKDEIKAEYELYTTGGLNEQSYSKFHWSKVWPHVTPDEIDPLQSAADFYLLFGIINNSFVKFEPLKLPSIEELERCGKILGKSPEDILTRQKEIEDMIENDPRSALTDMASEANKIFHDLVETLDNAFTEYVHLACGGELRHHKAFRPILGGYRKGAWAYWHYVYDQEGPESLLKMQELFLEFTGGSYGGKRWGDAAHILYQRIMGELGPDSFTNKQLFVDRVFSLEHNGGCFLNKLEWVNKREDREWPYPSHFASMSSTVLEAHSSKVIDIQALYGYASPETQQFVDKYLELALSFNMEILGAWDKKPVEENLSFVSAVPSTTITSDTPVLIDWDAYVEKIKPAKPIAVDVSADSMMEKIKEAQLSILKGTIT